MNKIAAGIFTGLMIASCLFAFSSRPAMGNREVEQTKHAFQDGDLIFQSSSSGQSRAIQLATKSKYSHMGVIYKVGNEYFVYEAVQPVQLTRLADWIKRGVDAGYVVKRLKHAREILTESNVKKMKRYGDKFRGKDYDLYFEWSDDRIYCSELIWKIYKEALDVEIGELQALRSFDLTSDVVKATMKKRYGNNVPLDEKVISPVAMFNSDKLVTVEEH